MHTRGGIGSFVDLVVSTYCGLLEHVVSSLRLPDSAGSLLADLILLAVLALVVLLGVHAVAAVVRVIVWVFEEISMLWHEAIDFFRDTFGRSSARNEESVRRVGDGDSLEAIIRRIEEANRRDRQAANHVSRN